MATETRQFRMHPKLLFDVIKRQAGTLAKAVLEGVMNAVDAKATKVQITVTATSVFIEDDGQGFADRAAIENFFETFGQPHEEKEEKRFGTFRMGRGQLFAFGLNNWRTGNFAMTVDIANSGLDYELTVEKEKAPGCQISIVLYQDLSLLDIRNLEDEVTRMVKWLDVPVFFGEKQISQHPSEGKWDQKDEVAFYRFREGGRLDVYNLGVLAEGVYGGQYGCGGEVVSRKQLKLNFARNSVMSDCPIWKKITAVLNAHSGRAVDKKKSLTAAQREYLARKIASGEVRAIDHADASLFTDVSGRHWSCIKMHQRVRECRKKITVAANGDGKGDKLMQQRLAFVLAEETLRRFAVPDLATLLKKILDPMRAEYEKGFEGTPTPYEELAATLSDQYDVIDEKDWTPLEQAVLRTIDSCHWDIIRAMTEERQARRLVLGKSDAANGWTDGEDYIAIDRRFLREVGQGLDGWIRLGQLMLHEYCHDAPSSGTHGHSPEFYELYHDSREAVGEFVKQAISRFPSKLEQAGKRASKHVLKMQDTVAALGDAVRKATADIA